MNARFITLASVLIAAALAGCERPPMASQQQGPRGAGMVQIENPRVVAAHLATLPAVPAGTPALPAMEGPKAKDVFQNVKVLGDLPVAEFTRHMAAITQWVAPDKGCTYCHTANLADDSLYTKVVSRRMLEMTRHLNADWGAHVGNTGVTCFTCHRGQPVPAQVWFKQPTPKNNRVGTGLGHDAGQNKATPAIAGASLPYDPFSSLLSGGKGGADAIRVQSTQALPVSNHTSLQQTEVTYSLMNHFSKSLGVNCTFCHNTQSFQSWNGPTQRVTAWHGIQMSRDLNSAYMEPLTATFPDTRRGPTGDVAKVFCATCHQGQHKPLGGVAMARDYIGLAPPAAAK